LSFARQRLRDIPDCSATKGRAETIGRARLRPSRISQASGGSGGASPSRTTGSCFFTFSKSAGGRGSKSCRPTIEAREIELAHSDRSTTDVLRTTVKWAARATGAASLGLLGLFVVSHAGAGELRPNLSETVGLLCFPGGVMLGLALAFRFDKAGALTVIVSCVAFYVWHYASSGGMPGGPYFLLFASPAVLFLISGLLRNSHPHSESTR